MAGDTVAARYRIVGVLSQSGTCITYEAEESADGRERVVIKERTAGAASASGNERTQPNAFLRNEPREVAKLVAELEKREFNLL